MRIPASSVEYLHVPVTADVAVAALPVEMAVIAGSLDPAQGDWKTASWSGTNAVLLVGPLIAGTTYTVWVRVTATPEVPVMRSGTLTAY